MVMMLMMMLLLLRVMWANITKGWMNLTTWTVDHGWITKHCRITGNNIRHAAKVTIPVNISTGHSFEHREIA